MPLNRLILLTTIRFLDHRRIAAGYRGTVRSISVVLCFNMCVGSFYCGSHLWFRATTIKL